MVICNCECTDVDSMHAIKLTKETQDNCMLLAEVSFRRYNVSNKGTKHRLMSKYCQQGFGLHHTTIQLGISKAWVIQST